MTIGRGYWQAISRIMAGEEGVFEKFINRFQLDAAQLAILQALEERRKNGEFNNETK